MSSELTVSEVHSHQDQIPSFDHQGQSEHSTQDGQNVPHGMGQSKSSRRRRRKRKGKGPEGGAELAQQSATGVESAPSQPIPSLQGAAQPASSGFQGGQQQNGTAATGKRWKKKFRDRDRQRTPENPGNIAPSGQQAGGHQIHAGAHQNNGGGHQSSNGYRDRDSHQPGNNGFKRKNSGGSNGGGGRQQRGPRSFVGPMDHSYRVVNGNFADTPPSTIETHGNYQGRSHGGGSRGYQSDSQPVDYSQGRTVPIAEDAPTKIYFFIEDLFFVAKIQETARKLGVKVAFIKNEKEDIAALTSHEEDDRPGLIVFDLNNASAKPMTLIPKLKAKLKKGTSIIGFLSHLQGDLKAKAVEAGCDTVMPRSAFSQNLPNLLRRYGIADEEEQNFNQ